jgi:hypothetical protein
LSTPSLQPNVRCLLEGEFGLFPEKKNNNSCSTFCQNDTKQKECVPEHVKTAQSVDIT